MVSMETSIVILTEKKHTVVLLSIIEMVNPRATVRFVTSSAELEALFAGSPRVDRFIAFCTSVVVPPQVLERLGGPAYNFHPGPRTHPGSYPAPFALYDGGKRFGVTAHVMHARVDSGPIVASMDFAIEPGADLGWLAARTLKAALKLFIHLCPALVRSTAPLPVQGAGWTGTRSTRKRLEALVQLPLDISSEELERRRRAFGQLEEFPLTITLHGRRFRMVAE